MYNYCFNNPINQSDSSGTMPAFINTLVSKMRKTFNQFRTKYGKFLSTCFRSINLNEEEQVLVATIAAEATVAANGNPVSSEARQAMANVVLNRVGQREWSQYSSVAEICQYTGFDGYGNENYEECLKYLNNRDGSNKTYEAIIWDVMTAYSNDITNGCQLYYTPAAMTNASGVPNWNFDVLIEVNITGIDPYYEGRFYKYR